MAQTFLDLGYAVDVIHYSNNTFLPRKDYSILVDSRWNLQRLAPLLPSDCIKIFHIDVPHTLFCNAADAGRLLAVQRRRGVTLQQVRFEMPNLGIEHADGATILGNDFTIKTYDYANKPLYPVPIIPVGEPWPYPLQKDFEACRKRFVWFGSAALVRKGLDLALEAFAGMPDYELFVCGPIAQENDFVQAFQKELYETPNIHTIGWIDTNSQEFVDLTNRCIGLIFPSAAEGQCGSVVTCLHAGLIPIISYESGVDVYDFGVILRECSLNEIQSSVRAVSRLPVQELGRMSRKAWEYARANHTKERFAEKYRRAVEEIIAAHGKRGELSDRIEKCGKESHSF